MCKAAGRLHGYGLAPEHRMRVADFLKFDKLPPHNQLKREMDMCSKSNLRAASYLLSISCRTSGRGRTTRILMVISSHDNAKMLSPGYFWRVNFQIGAGRSSIS
eukprot:7384099-Prymnesium_polylepis.3